MRLTRDANGTRHERTQHQLLAIFRFEQVTRTLQNTRTLDRHPQHLRYSTATPLQHNHSNTTAMARKRKSEHTENTEHDALPHDVQLPIRPKKQRRASPHPINVEPAAATVLPAMALRPKHPRREDPQPPPPLEPPSAELEELSLDPLFPELGAQLGKHALSTAIIRVPQHW